MAGGKFGAELKFGGERKWEELNKIKRLSGIALFDSVVLATPVDEGRLRANWQCSLGDFKSGVVDIRPPSEVAAEIRAEINPSQLGDTLWLSNNLDYADAIENGHSAQAPRGMAKTSAANWENIVHVVARSVAP